MGPQLQRLMGEGEEEMMFAVRREVLGAMFKDPEWSDRLGRAQNVEDTADVVAAYCRSRNMKVVEVTTPTRAR